MGGARRLVATIANLMVMALVPLACGMAGSAGDRAHHRPSNDPAQIALEIDLSAGC